MPITGAVSGAVSAFAKINLFLHVGEKRADGFHPLQSLAVFANLGDTVEARDGEGLSLEVVGPFAPSLGSAEDNLVMKAARALAGHAACDPRAALILTKNLPVASGIGGGSADAAATLRALRTHWRLTTSDAELAGIAAELGSDVPVCIASQPAFMEGRGEVVTPVISFPRVALLLVNPGIGLSTREVFSGLETRRGTPMTLPRGRFGDSADLLRFLETTGNDLEAPARALAPAIGTVLEALAALPGALFTRMSGSGATCFGLFPDDDSCARAAATLHAKYPGWWVSPSFVPEFNIEHDDMGQDIGPTPDGL